MAEYVGAAGFVQFDPNTREANGQDVLDLTIKTPGSEGTLIRITVWPELQTPAVLSVEKGDYVAVDGKLNVGTYEKDGESKKSIQISATAIAVLKGEERAEREVVNESKGKSAKDLF